MNGRLFEQFSSSSDEYFSIVSAFRNLLACRWTFSESVLQSGLVQKFPEIKDEELQAYLTKPRSDVYIPCLYETFIETNLKFHVDKLNLVKTNILFLSL